MEIFKFEDSAELEQLIKSTLSQKKLIPIIGAGFTKGEPTKYGAVPDGQELIDTMIESICTYTKDIDRSDFDESNNSFSDVADEYFKYVPQNTYKELLKSRFTNVSIAEIKRKFLEVNWPYIYTLNIDDGIEKNSRYTPILPYKKVSPNATNDYHCVFKMHGDVSEEIKYDQPPNIIFSSEQYIKSLEGNASILSLFQSDYISNNIIFIGCSLQDELDLSYAITTIGDEASLGAKKIYVTTSEPKGRRKSKLERFGINIILVLESYEEFYQKIYEWSKEVEVSETSDFDKYKNIKIEIIQKNIEENKKYIVDIIGKKSSEKTLPYYNTTRKVQATILKNYYKDTFTVISGKRFSGKTFLAKSLNTAIADRDTYYFPSTISLSNAEINDLSHTKNSVFIFDSSSLNLENAIFLEKTESNLEKNGSHVIILTNKNDSLFSSIASRLTQQNFYDLDNKMDMQETDILNKRLSEIGLIESLKNKSLMDNCYRYNELYENTFNGVENKNYPATHILLLILLATDSKIYSVLTTIFDIKRKEIENFTKELSPFVEQETTQRIETHQHSGFKLLLNSSVWAFYLLGKIYQQKGSEIIVKQISSIVEKLKGKAEFRSIYGKIIGFDNLNQIFSGEARGSSKLIFEIYSALENTLHDDPHYWLQRSKSILHLRRTDTDNLKIAIDYAKKSFYDTKNVKLKINATTTLALLYGRLSNEESYSNLTTIINAVDWYHDSIQDKTVNRKYIDAILNKNAGNNDLSALTKHLLKNNRSTQFDSDRNRKISFLINSAATTAGK